MAIEFKWPRCGKPLQADDETAGQKAKRPRRGKDIQVPRKKTWAAFSCRSCGRPAASGGEGGPARGRRLLSGKGLLTPVIALTAAVVIVGVLLLVSSGARSPLPPPETETPPARAAEEPRTEEIDLMPAGDDVGAWSFNNGPEFPGATGELTLDRSVPTKRRPALRLYGDLSKGGNYVQAGVDLPPRPVRGLVFWVKSPRPGVMAMRLVDSSGQCHQIRLRLQETEDWQEICFPVAEFFRLMREGRSLDIVGGRYENWGGAKDSRWHGPGKSLSLLTGRQHFPDGKKGAVLIAGVTLVADRAAYAEGFEGGASLPDGWETEGDVSVSGREACRGDRSLRMARSLDRVRDRTRAIGPSFPAAPGTWLIAGACKPDLHSPDDSYGGRLSVEALDGRGAPLLRLEAQNVSGRGGWQTFSRSVDLPVGTAKARLAIELHKTYGTFLVDELSASLTSSGKKRVEQILISTDRLGNLLLPDDRPVVHVKVEAPEPLKAAERRLRYAVHDYWGLEQASPAEVELLARGRANGHYVYAADLDLGPLRLDVGRYYEVRVHVPCEGRPAGEHSGLAILPVAETKDYRPGEIPFTIRNWDSRVRDYFYLADRLGIRQLGVWGGWKGKPPYKPHLPGLEHVKKLDAGWVTGTPGNSVERNGFTQYSEEALRKGMRNFLEEYAHDGLMMICLGNEPHGRGGKVLENVRAYKVLYEAAKGFGSNVVVVATSVNHNEEYFKAGYQNYCDAYDFHVYETYNDVRRAIRKTRELMNKYNAPKPIHCTELGLKSQGMTRRTIACELVKKVTSFFAEGGATVSWFTIQYPDPKGVARGTSGDAHCVFDCKYNLYNPRLDAIAYYNMVNGICVKQFDAERRHPDGAQAYLFRDADDRCLQVLWNDEARRDVFVPLPGVPEVEIVRVDGGRTRLVPDSLAGAPAGVTLTISFEPVLLFYSDEAGGLPSFAEATEGARRGVILPAKPGGEGRLPEALGRPRVALETAPNPVAKGSSSVFTLGGRGLTPKSVRIAAPPRWTATAEGSGRDRLKCTVVAPEETEALEGRFLVRVLGRTGAPCGEIRVSVPLAGSAR